MEKKVKINSVTYWYPHLSCISRKAKIGKGTIIHAGVHIHDEVKIGRRCKIQAQVYIPNGVTIEDEVFIGPQVGFANDSKMIGFDANFKPEQTLVKRGAKIGLGAKINAGIIIGEYAVVGAGAVVLKDIPPYEKWAGVPARKIQ